MNCQERECVVDDWEESCWWFFVVQINIFCHRARTSKQWLFANDVGVWIKPLESSRKLPVRLCLAHKQKWPFKPSRGHVTRLTWQGNSYSEFSWVFSTFPGFFRLFPGFVGPRATAYRQGSSCIDARRQLRILNWRWSSPMAIWRQLFLRLPKIQRLSFRVCITPRIRRQNRSLANFAV